MSLIQYNGVTLPYSYHSSFNQESVYDDSGTNWILTKISLDASCVINTAYAATIDPSLSTTASAAEIAASIRRKLLQPRKRLSVKFDGVNIIPEIQTGIEGTVDAKNGPQPQSCNFTMLTNTTFLMNYSIVSHYWESPLGTATQSNAAGGTALSNRWTESVEIDSRNYSIRSRSGRVMIRSDNVLGEIPDAVRLTMATCGIPKGFKRKSGKYTVSADGLALDYDLQDEEVYLFPPSPAFEAGGEYIESSTKLGAVSYGRVRVSLKGSKTTPKFKLLTTAVSVGMSKLIGGGLNIDKGKAFLNSASLRTDLYENNVTFEAEGRIKARKARINNIAGVKFSFLSNIAAPPLGSDPAVGKAPAWSDRGTADFLLQAAAYYDPSVKNVIDPAKGQLKTGLAPGEAGKQVEGANQ